MASAGVCCARTWPAAGREKETTKEGRQTFALQKRLKPRPQSGLCFFCLGYRFFFSVEGGPVAVELGGVLGALGLQVRVLPRQPLDFVLRRTSNHSQHTITGNIQ